MKNTKKINVTLPAELVGAINEMQKQEMKSRSAIISEAVRIYCAKRRMDFYRLDLSSAGKKASIITMGEINKVVRKLRTVGSKKIRS